MTAIVEPPATQVVDGAALSRADGLELLGEVHGSGYRDGICLVRRADGQMVQLGPLMYGLLECADGRRDRTELAAAMSARLGRRLDEEHVDRLAEKLADQGLLAGSEENAPPRRNPLLALRWKYLVTDPKVTRHLTVPFTGLFRPWVVYPVLVAFLGVAWFVLVHKGVAAATAEAFNKPELLLLVFALAVGSAGFHELGHAAACRYGGATPGGMGVGIYMVWPAFYTDVTDAYRLRKRDRLRVDLGGLYFNAVVAVATLALWLALRVDALLLLIALQLLQMVKQLSPVIRSDGYHILSDATGVPDLYAHIGPTLRRLLPGHHKEPSALTGRARVLVTAWVLIVVPVLLAMAASAVLLMPRLAATAWASGQNIVGGMPQEIDDGRILDALASVLRLFALVLPVVGALLMTQRITRTGIAKAHRWSADSRPRRIALGFASAVVATALVWAWWPSGQYQQVRANEGGGTIAGIGRLVTSPQTAVRPQPEAARLTPGKHLAVAMIPEGGATQKHPAIVLIKGDDGQKPVVLVTDALPDARHADAAETAAPGTVASSGSAPTAAEPPSSAGTPTDTVPVTAFPFKLPSKPGPHGTQALAVNTTDGAIKYDIAYALVTVRDGQPVDETNEAYAFASCAACTTWAVSFQVVLIVGQSDLIAPINVAGALNVNCPACITTAIAQQIVVTLNGEPSDELLSKLTDELKQLDALSALGGDASPEQIAAHVDEVEEQIKTELQNSGLMTTSTSTSTSSTTSTESGTTPTTTETTPTETETSTTDEPAPTTTETTPTETTPTTTTDTTTTDTTTTDTTTTDTTTTDTTTTDTTTTETTTTTDTTPTP